MRNLTNYTQLWASFITITTRYGDERTRAVLMNCKDKKEHILKRFGVIGSSDLTRIENEYKNRSQ